MGDASLVVRPSEDRLSVCTPQGSVLCHRRFAVTENPWFGLLKAYPINSMLELQLATEFIAFSQSAMQDLRLAKADPDMPAPERRKLRAGAVALNRAGHRTLRTLEKVFQARGHDAGGEAKPATPKPPNLSP